MMTHLDVELKRLKDESVELFELVISQLRKGRIALLDFDKDLAREVNFNEKRVNALELKIDKDCENIFALFNPVAIDLRFVLAVLKINSNLERIGDIADGIARYVIEADAPFHGDLLKVTRLDEMYTLAIEMLEDVRKCFNEEDTRLARGVFKKDDVLDDINGSANRVVEALIRKEAEHIAPALHIISTIRKLERTGDQVKNIAEEIIFYLEAKVL
ncbi:MAG TPA: phosphate signaling complex protein PhoU, partial [Bacteroidia bacterium]|nr:phosphate signaling complex protein PhoU [Bacteroidia bacterium]